MSDELKLNFETLAAITRRHFFRECGTGLGTMALASLLNERLFAIAAEPPASALAPKPPHFSAKVKNIIYLFMAGAPSQLDLFDYKPRLQQHHGQAIPEDILVRIVANNDCGIHGEASLIQIVAVGADAVLSDFAVGRKSNSETVLGERDP